MTSESGGIRPAQQGDAAQIFSIIEASRARAAFPIGPNWSEAQVADECRQLGWIWQPSGQSAQGFILFRDMGSAYEISFLATNPDARGQGGMSRLLKHMIDFLPPQKSIWMEVHEQNRAARQLYLKSGFLEVGKRPSYYVDGGAAVLYNYG